MNEGNTAIQVSPVVQDKTPPQAFNPEDQMSVRSFFEMIADTVVDASELKKIVASLREELDTLRHDIEAVREANYRMDQEIVELRSQRDSARADNENLRGILSRQSGELEQVKADNENLRGQNERIYNDQLNTSNQLDTARKERDDAQMKVMELEDKVASLSRDVQHWQELANTCQTKLDTLRSVFRD